MPLICTGFDVRTVFTGTFAWLAKLNALGVVSLAVRSALKRETKASAPPPLLPCAPPLTPGNVVVAELVYPAT